MVNVLLSQYNFHECWANGVLSNYISKQDKVVVIPFAFKDEWIKNNQEWMDAYGKETGKFYNEIIHPFIQYGINEDNIKWLNYFKHSSDKMRNIISNSDIVFLTGGLPEQAVKRVVEKNILVPLQQSKMVIGSSAGAMMQLNNYYISPDEDYPNFSYGHGLDLVKDDFYIEVHYDESEIQNECIKRVCHEKKCKVYAIKDKGGVIIDGGERFILGDVTIFK